MIDREKTEKFTEADGKTMLTFALLTPMLYLHLSRHLQNVLPVTCLVPAEKNCALKAGNGRGGAKRLREAIEELYRIGIEDCGDRGHAE